MHAVDRYGVLLDASVLVPHLRRELILTLMKADFVRCHWSPAILEEVERGVARRVTPKHGETLAAEKASRLLERMAAAFDAALVEREKYEHLIPALGELPDPSDGHVIAAAIACNAQAIITDNLRHFPARLLDAHDLIVETADQFIANTLDLKLPHAVCALREMREQRLRQPAWTVDRLFERLPADGLAETAAALEPYRTSL